ncbi:MAG: sulfatase [Armatimonadota bacterium]|nr:sulfatase [Armatimonadota bacterium]
MRIIYFDIDCLRPDHLGCYGYNRPTSPNIDRIAKQGVRFDHYYCADSPCLPSRMNWSSGRFGINNGVVSNNGAGAKFNIRKRGYQGPMPENEMLMRQLRKVGWDPVSMSNFADRHNAWEFMCGWSEFHTPNLKGGGETAEEIHRPLMRWLKNNAKRENYLLHINYWDAHRLYKMDASWADRFKDYPVTQAWPDEDAIKKQQELKGSFTTHRQFLENKSLAPLMPGAIDNRKDFEHMITGYDAAIAYVDHHVGIVLDELARQNALDDAVVIISADHGDNFGEHGIYSDHVCADEAIHNIPLIIRWPGVTPENHNCGSFLYNVDLSATLCDMLGADIPSEWDGVSFGNQLKGKPGKERNYLVWGHALYTVQRAVRTKTHLMIKTYDQLDYELDPVQLYDLEKDPYQTKDIKNERPDIVCECEDYYMNDWLKTQRAKPHAIPDPFNAVLKERGKEAAL